MEEQNRGPIDASRIPRFAGPPTFALLPRRDEVDRCDVVVAGVPFDSGTSYRPGARFGPAAVRQGSRLLRPWHPGLEVAPFGVQQVADAGDIACNPFSIAEAVDQIDAAATALLGNAGRLLAIGGDHTIALPLLRAVRRRFGPVALVHFDAHLDTWDTYFGAPVTHGTPFRRAAEEGLFLEDRSIHVGVRGPVYAASDFAEDAGLGFRVVGAMDLEHLGVAGVVARIRDRAGEAPLYVSIDIDVLDPAHAPGTGTPEAGGLTSRELLGILRGLAGMRLVGADVVEVSPAYDHAEMTAVAAAHACYELLALFAAGSGGGTGAGDTGRMVDDTARERAIYHALKAADEVAAALQAHLIEEHGAGPDRSAPQGPATNSLKLLRQARERLGEGLRAVEADAIAESDSISLRNG